MGKVTIYLRMIEEGETKKLALYDTNGQGGIDDLTTTVYAENTVYWSLDNMSGIKEINSVYAKDKSKQKINFNPKRKTYSKGFKWKIPKGTQGDVKYGIKFIDHSGEEIDIDPVIVVPPPPD